MAKIADIRGLNTRIEKGAWVENMPNLTGLGIKVRVRGFANTDHRKLMGELYADVSDEDRKNPESEKGRQNELIARTLLLDWKGLEDFPYNEKNVKLALTDPSLSILREGIDFASKTVAQSGVEKLEADVKK